jgi:hypothetical protein
LYWVRLREGELISSGNRPRRVVHEIIVIDILLLKEAVVGIALHDCE